MTGCEPSPPGPGAALRACALRIGYAGRPLIDGIDVRLEPGEALALVGVNGSGKSTLLKTFAGLLAPLAGTLEVLGSPSGTRPDRLAYLGQFHPAAGLLPLRVRDVVLMARYRQHGLLGRLRREDHRIVAESLERVEMADHALRPLRALSGGQQQRVYLAHALARRADLLLLDEPTAGLDAHAQERYVGLVAEERARGAAVVIATHDVRDAARASQVLLLAGRVVAAGPPVEVLQPERLSEAFGISMVAVPHGDHHDLFETGHAHGHGERITGDHEH
ncbi:MAG: metal ABC transporter ATP-binding protein [Acidimicrobiales bacterium]